jgi:thiamine-monophosphate kinase
VVSITALGSLEGRSAVTRSGARAGDVVAVCGQLGWSAAGMAVLRRGFRSPVAMVAAHRTPRPPWRAGPVAARAGATSMIDTSDGLLADLGHVARASGVRIALDRDAFGVPYRLGEIASALGADPLTWILTGGEDHALAATFPPDAVLPEGWTVIGSVEAGDPGVLVDGRVYSGGPAGWDHFAH